MGDYLFCQHTKNSQTFKISGALEILCPVATISPNFFVFDRYDDVLRTFMQKMRPNYFYLILRISGLTFSLYSV
jgi:hypothetical protein